MPQPRGFRKSTPAERKAFGYWIVAAKRSGTTVAARRCDSVEEANAWKAYYKAAANGRTITVTRVKGDRANG